MRNIFKYIAAIAAGALLLSSCVKNLESSGYLDITGNMTVDREVIDNVAAQDPADESIILKADAAWLVSAPSWITVQSADAHNYGGSGSNIITITIKPNYKNAITDTEARSGEIKFSSHGTNLIVTVHQNGFTAPHEEVTSLGGIPDKEEFMMFVEAVNSGAALDRWTNEDGFVALLTDIDISEIANWTPIGNAATSNAGAVVEGTFPFTAKFDGCAHAIKGLKINVPVDSHTEKGAYGLFGVVDGGVVKNLVLQASDIYVETACKLTHLGALVGAAVNGSTIENCSVLNMNGTTLRLKVTEGTTGALYVGGVTGLLHASTVNDCKNGVPVQVYNETNNQNGGNGIHMGGIAGFTNGEANIKACVNDAQIGGIVGGERWGSAARMGGLAGSCNALVNISGCVNNGDVLCTVICTSDKSSRTAGFASYVNTANSLVENCVNNGDICYVIPDGPDTYAGYVSGFVGQPNAVISIIGCENYGAILSDRCVSTGTLGGDITADHPEVGVVMGRPNSKATNVKNCKIGGKVGPYSDASKVVTLTATNFSLFMYGDTVGRRTAAETNAANTDNVFGAK